MYLWSMTKFQKSHKHSAILSVIFIQACTLIIKFCLLSTLTPNYQVVKVLVKVGIETNLNSSLPLEQVALSKS